MTTVQNQSYTWPRFLFVTSGQLWTQGFFKSFQGTLTYIFDHLRGEHTLYSLFITLTLHCSELNYLLLLNTWIQINHLCFKDALRFFKDGQIVPSFKILPFPDSSSNSLDFEESTENRTVWSYWSLAWWSFTSPCKKKFTSLLQGKFWSF